MSAVTVIYALLFYAATAILVIGVMRKIALYARTPQPLKIPTTPAPTTRLGVAMRMAREVTVFESLFKSNKWTWLVWLDFPPVPVRGIALAPALFYRARLVLCAVPALVHNLHRIRHGGRTAGTVGDVAFSWTGYATSAARQIT